MAVKSVEVARANLEGSLPIVRDRYMRGIQSADWATPAGSDAAEAAWSAGVQAAAAQKRRQAGIQRVGNAAWQQASMTKGANAITESIRASLNKYATNFGRVYAIAGPQFASLPPRTSDPYANVTQRVIGAVRIWRQAAGKQ